MKPSILVSLRTCASWLCLLPLAGCVQATVERAPDGAVRASVTRLWANTSIAVNTLTGEVVYSSQPQSEAVGKALDIAGEAITRLPRPLVSPEPAAVLP